MRFVKTPLVVLVVALAAQGTAASASDNVRPSSAPPVDLGVPFSGSWYGTPTTSDDIVEHWWRLTSRIHTGDSLQIAVDNSGSGYEAFLCFTSPVDDYGADEAVEKCSFKRVGGRQLSRLTLRYNGISGQPLLIVTPRSSDDAHLYSQSGGYSATIETIITRVNIGAIARRVVKHSFAYKATLRYGDNTAAVDGTSGVLQWRRASGAPGPKSFKDLASANSVGGRLRFVAKLPKKARKRLQLRACVFQPGGPPRCTRADTVKVAAKKRRQSRR